MVLCSLLSLPIPATNCSPWIELYLGHLRNIIKQANTWLFSHPGRPISIYDISEIAGKAFPLAFSSTNICKGFEVSGIAPLNENIFTDDEFLSSYVTDRSSMEQPSALTENSHIFSDLTPNEHFKQNDYLVNNPSSFANISVNSPIPGTSTSETTVSPENIRPYPKALPRIMKGFRKRAKSAILTSTAEKQRLEEEQLKRARKKDDKQQRSQFKFSLKQPKVKAKSFPENVRKTWMIPLIQILTIIQLQA